MPSFLPVSLGKLWDGGSGPLLSPSPFPILGELGALGWKAGEGREGPAGLFTTVSPRGALPSGTRFSGGGVCGHFGASSSTEVIFPVVFCHRPHLLSLVTQGPSGSTSPIGKI